MVILKDTSLAAVIGVYVELLRTGLEIKEVLSNPLQVLFVVAAPEGIIGLVRKVRRR